jgi:hypothetical protein
VQALAAWSSDKETDDNLLDPDFLAIIDATPTSRTYGKVLTTATLHDVLNTNLLDQMGLANNGISSNVLNEGHHMAHNSISKMAITISSWAGSSAPTSSSATSPSLLARTDETP